MFIALSRKQKIRYYLPFLIIAIALIFSWFQFIITDLYAVSAHYLGLILFLPVVYFTFIKPSFKKALIALGFYLLLGTINLLSFTTMISSSAFGLSIGSFAIWTPSLNFLSLLLFTVYLVLNFDTLIEFYLDYKEAKGKL